MNKAIISGGLTVSAADVVPTVNWALGGFHGAPPASLSGLIAGAIVMAVHAAYNWWGAKQTAKTAAPVAAADGGYRPIQSSSPLPPAPAPQP